MRAGQHQDMTSLLSGVYTVCCDESEFTGNNLLDAQQPHFAYAGRRDRAGVC
jgi:hypothetical protein